MSIRSKGHKRYRMQKSSDGVFVLDLNDVLDDHIVDFDLENQLVSNIIVPGLGPREHNTAGPPVYSTCSLTKDQILYLKASLKDFPEVIKEMNI